MIYATLGPIIFAAHGAPNQLRTTDGEDYAQLKLVGRKPTLQATGGKLVELELELGLHASFTNVDAAIAALRAAMAARTAMPLVLGSGRHLGRYVIASLNIAPIEAAADGRLVAATVSAKLTEFVAANPVVRRSAQRTPRGGPAIVPAGTPNVPTFDPSKPIAPHNLMPIDMIIAKAGVKSAAMNRTASSGAAGDASAAPAEVATRAGG